MPENGVLMIVEVPRANYRRQFYLDCPHATSDVLIDNFPSSDGARASGIIGRLIDQHREVVKKKEGEVCGCQARNSRSTS